MQDWITAVSPLCEIIFKLTLIISIFTNILLVGISAIGLTFAQPLDYISDGSALYPQYTHTPTITVKSLIGDYSPSDRVSELAYTIHLAENINNEDCNLNGCRYGIGAMMIVQSTFDEQCTGDVYNLEDNIKCGIKMIEAGQLWRWKQSAYDMPNHTGWLNRLQDRTYAEYILQEHELYRCSCIAYMRDLGHTFPRVIDPSYLEPNSPPVLGGLILLDMELPHIAEVIDFRAGALFYVERILIGGECITRTNAIEYNDSRIRGYRND